MKRKEVEKDAEIADEHEDDFENVFDGLESAKD